jgi:site-specific DNA-methyltransferase (adenine-specific)
VNLLLTDKITILPNRQRRKFDEGKLIELQESIIQNGLLHPIVVRLTTDLGCVLVAGERRTRAIKAIHELGEAFRCGGEIIAPNMYPCIDIGQLTEEEAYEAELEENIQRDDLTWQERAAATARLMELRTLQATRSGGTKPTTATIAQEIHGRSDGGFASDTREEIILARHLNNPEVAKAKSAKEAFKVLKHQEQRSRNKELAARVGSTFTVRDHVLLQGSCLDLLPTLAEGSFDCLLTDPPYGMGADEFGDSGGRLLGSHQYDDSYEAWLVLIEAFTRNLSRVMKPQSHAYVFCDIERFSELKQFFDLNGWKVFRTPLIWVNPKGMRAPWPEHGPQRKYQTILYAHRGDRPTLKLAPDVLTYPSDTNEGHAAQKPVDLLRDLLQRSCHPGDSVLDPFCGSGSIFPASHTLKVKATGIEMDAASYGLATKRLGGLSG